MCIRPISFLRFDDCCHRFSLLYRRAMSSISLSRAIRFRLVRSAVRPVVCHVTMTLDVAGAGCSPAQSPPCCTKCNSPLISCQCTNHRIAGPLLCGFNVTIKGLNIAQVRLYAAVEITAAWLFLCSHDAICSTLFANRLHPLVES